MQKFRKLIFDDEAFAGNIEKATELSYIKILRFNLSILNAWPAKELGENYSKYIHLHSFLQIIAFIFCISTGALFIWLHSEISFYELGHSIISCLMGCVTLMRIIFTLPQATKYRTTVTTFLTKMHLLFFKDVSDYAMKTHRKVHFISHRFTVFLTGQMFAGLLLFNFIPIWKNYSAGNYKQKILYNTTYEHTLYLAVPVLKIYTHFDAYMVAFTYNFLQSVLCSMMFCMLDLLLILMVFNIWGHLKILLNDLETFPFPANKVVLSTDYDRHPTVNAGMYSGEELKGIFEKLKRCIDYHRHIKDFTEKMSDTFGPILLSYYMFHQVSGCLLLLECSQMTAEALVRYLPLSVIIFQELILLSVIFELVATTSGKLKDAVYGVPWQYMDTNNRKIVSIFLYNVQEPMQVKAMGVVSVGVTTMATILKTSLSYFTFLRSV